MGYLMPKPSLYKIRSDADRRETDNDQALLTLCRRYPKLNRFAAAMILSILYL